MKTIGAITLGALWMGSVLACGGDEPQDSPVDASPPIERQLGGHCPLAERLGGFSVETGAEYSTIDGRVNDGVIPVTILETVLSEGDCALLRRNNPFCDPPCQAGQTCDLDGSCVRFPEKQDVGVVTIRGLVQDVTMEPLMPTNDYFVLDLPHPVFEPDSVISLTSTDGRYGELDLLGYGVSGLTLGEEQWTVTAGEDLTVTWDAPDDVEPRSRVFLALNIDQHGITPVTLQCDHADSGQAIIPAAVIDAMLEFGVSGFPSGRLTRGTADSQTVSDGCVEFVVSAPRVQAVEVSGHTPCNHPDDCPPGQTCDILNQTCI